jgi:uncharacterized membrane protein YgaE (UPF0421/DUF939 family)
LKRNQLVTAWLALQATAAATVAWLAANLVHAEDQPFFAPVVAVVALTAPRGERGTKAVQLFLGVFLGIAIGEIVVALMGAGYGRLAVAAFLALSIAALIGDARVALTQAGVSAILTVISAQGDAGWQRLLDAAIGGGVALIFTQIVFSPEPVALLRRAETDVLKGIASGLTRTADALRGTDQAAVERALMKTLWLLPARLGELARLRQAGPRMARRSAIWQSQRAEVSREKAHADQLALIAGGSVMLARTSCDVTSPARELLADRLREVGAVLERLAEAQGDRAARQQAVNDALAASRPLGVGDASDPNVAAAFGILGIVARDIMIFGGLNPHEATDAMRGKTADAEVPRPPAAPRLPFGLDRRRIERRLPGKLSNRDPDRADGRAKE